MKRLIKSPPKTGRPLAKRIAFLSNKLAAQSLSVCDEIDAADGAVIASRTSGWEREWVLEADRREADIVAGKSFWLPGEEVMARLRAQLK